jgi:hypothetical protein
VNWMPLAPCRTCHGTGTTHGIGGRKVPCGPCEGTGGGNDFALFTKGLLLLLHRTGAGDAATWRLKLVMGQHKTISPTFGGRARRIRTSGTTVAVLQTTWDTLAEAQAGAELAAGLLVVGARRPAATSNPGVEA